MPLQTRPPATGITVLKAVIVLYHYKNVNVTLDFE